MNDNPDEGDRAGARRERFERLYAEHHARVLGYVLRRARSCDAADIVADTFLVAWRRLDDAPKRESHLWLYAVARRVIANHRRGEQRRSHLADRLRREWAGRVMPNLPESFPHLVAAFRSLPDADREILALEAWEQLDPGEIAAVLGCSRNAARIRLHRARRRLRAAMQAPDLAHKQVASAARKPILTEGDIA